MATTGNSDVVNVPNDKEQGADEDLPTAEEQLESIGLGRFNYIVLITMVLFNVAYGMEILVTNMSFRAMPHEEWNMTDHDRARLVSISYVGFTCGAFLSGTCSDIYGRRPLIFLHSILFVPFAIWSALAQNIETVYATRLVVGLSVGIMLPVSISLVAEVALPSQRGWMILAVPGLGFVFGQILVLFVGIAAMHSDVECSDNCGWWRWVFAAGVVPDAFALALFLAFVPESPRYLLYADRRQEAEKVIRSIAEFNNAENRLLRGGKISPLDKAGRNVSAWDLFQPPLRADVTIVTFVWTMFSFGLFSLSFVLPIILEQVYHLNSFQVFSIFLFFVLSEAISIIIVIFIVDLPNFGRLFFLLTCSFTAVPFFLGLFFVMDKGLVLICSFFFILKAANGVAYQTVYIYAAELLPTSHRSMGVGFANGFSKLSGVTAPIILTSLSELVGMRWGFVLMGLVVASGAIVLVFYSTETLGRSLADLAPHADDASHAPLSAEEKSAAATTSATGPTERTPLL